MKWSKSDTEMLRKLYPNYSNREISKMTGWNYTELLNKAKSLRLTKLSHVKSRAMGKIEVTPEMELFLKENYDKMTNPQLAEALGMRLTKTREFLYALGLQRMKLEYWTEEQINYLKANYRTKGDKELAEIFNQKWKKEKGWKLKHIEKKRKYLKLLRTKTELLAIKDRAKQQGVYSKGNYRMWQTRGVTPEGTILFWKHSSGRPLAVIKVNGTFIHYGRHRYKQLHGDIPAGMNVIYADGNSANLSDENLKLVSDAELSLINNASQKLTDNYIAGVMTHGDPELRKKIKLFPQLIELKRQQLILQRTINNHNNDKNANRK